MADFMANNYMLIIVIIVLVIMAVVGYLADKQEQLEKAKRRKKRKEQLALQKKSSYEKKQKDEEEEEVAEEVVDQSTIADAFNIEFVKEEKPEEQPVVEEANEVEVDPTKDDIFSADISAFTSTPVDDNASDMFTSMPVDAATASMPLEVQKILEQATTQKEDNNKEKEEV